MFLHLHHIVKVAKVVFTGANKIPTFGYFALDGESEMQGTSARVSVIKQKNREYSPNVGYTTKPVQAPAFVV
ncbi:hypothetical protein [Desertivirga xinjiangensis]|uniref:hypothetical protein n=1 Tax=Desertivirga xinjiangensis TaxID=539206 RepID=UPI0021088819|nr:hypothetical protein [Pedobacter xinjiangensis]